MKATAKIIILCVVSTFVYWTLTSSYAKADLLEGHLLFSSSSLLQGRIWVVFTALFIHADPLHLVANMVFLYGFGSGLENEIGAAKVLAAFLTGGVLSFILSIFVYQPDTVMLGASAAIFTLAAVAMLTRPLKFSWVLLMPLGLVALLYFVYNVAAVLTGSGGNVGYLGHVTGFIIGLTFGIAWNPAKWKRNLLIAVALLIAYYVVMFLLNLLFEGLLWSPNVQPMPMKQNEGWEGLGRFSFS